MCTLTVIVSKEVALGPVDECKEGALGPVDEHKEDVLGPVDAHKAGGRAQMDVLLIRKQQQKPTSV